MSHNLIASIQPSGPGLTPLSLSYSTSHLRPNVPLTGSTTESLDQRHSQQASDGLCSDFEREAETYDPLPSVPVSESSLLPSSLSSPSKSTTFLRLLVIKNYLTKARRLLTRVRFEMSQALAVASFESSYGDKALIREPNPLQQDSVAYGETVFASDTKEARIAQRRGQPTGYRIDELESTLDKITARSREGGLFMELSEATRCSFVALVLIGE
ncbi:unnamed protein product [Protopolystoma xenopodis]|uniref:Uncharacterized protein n=1 Tax=Protopolystoma xenopodis TaxID=117903 RepID=A0A3S5BCP9_9PLAT|nr:unnamed protein product [Protopolystoma xenopodis]